MLFFIFLKKDNYIIDIFYDYIYNFFNYYSYKIFAKE